MAAQLAEAHRMDGSPRTTSAKVWDQLIFARLNAL
jgi:hypothetical protein